MRKYITILVLITALAIAGCNGGPEPMIGTNGLDQLSPCPDSPNCVSTQSTDKARFIEPLHWK